MVISNFPINDIFLTFESQIDRLMLLLILIILFESFLSQINDFSTIYREKSMEYIRQVHLFKMIYNTLYQTKCLNGLNTCLHDKSVCETVFIRSTFVFYLDVFKSFPLYIHIPSLVVSHSSMHLR